MIVFEKIRFKNFGSFGNYWTEVDLSSYSSTLVSGINGHGKSFAIFDSITFVLFGRPYRNINKPNLVNSINGKNCVVEVEFSSNNKSYKIIRGISPTIFEIYEDGKLIDQGSTSKDYQSFLEENILHLSFKSFCQVVILGSSNYVPFMQLTAADRRAVIEDLLDIQIFTTMNVVLKSKLQKLQQNLAIFEKDLDIRRHRIADMKDSISELKGKDQKLVKEYQSKIQSLNESILESEQKIADHQKKIVELTTEVVDKNVVLSETTEIQKIQSEVSKTLKSLDKSLSFFEQNEHCPTCQQPIDSEFRTKVVEEKKKKRQAAVTAITEIESGLSELQSRLNEYAKFEKQIGDITSQIQKLNGSILVERKAIADYEKTLVQLSTKDSIILEKESKLSGLLSEETKLVDSINESKITNQYYDIASTMLKDSGIKSRIIAKYIPVINKLIAFYLSKLDFFVSFTLDENLKESIRSRHRDDFMYTSFSEGEKMRIDLALLLTWREIAKKKNKVNTNLLLLDEVFDSSLDSSGVEEFIKILTVLSGWNKDTNIFVITHRMDSLADKFSNSIRFEKKNDFSYLLENNNTAPSQCLNT